MAQTPFDIARYRKDGFCLARRLVDAEALGHLQNEADRLWSLVEGGASIPGLQWRDHVTEGRVPDRIDPVDEVSAVFAQTARLPALREAAQTIAGGEVFVLKDKIIFKHPGTTGYGLHQDFPYWDGLGLKADEVFTATIALDPMNAENGALACYPGCHRELLPASNDNPLDTDPEALRGRDADLVSMEPGDVLFFHALTPHFSGPNRAQMPRRVYHITYATLAVDPVEARARYRAMQPVVHQVHAKGYTGSRPIGTA